MTCSRIFLQVMILLIGNSSYCQEAMCGFQYMLKKNTIADPSIVDKITEVNRTLSQPDDYVISAVARENLFIPVVVHIVKSESDRYISDEAIFSQIQILNRDFNAKNLDLNTVPDEFKPNISNGGIEFCLAVRNDGNSDKAGIIRQYTDVEFFGLNNNLYYTDRGGSTAWDTEKYLNIWVADTGESISGFGSYPGQTEAYRQGVVIHPAYFGENESRRYNLGRVAVHEVGHYLGLNHVWDNNGNCDTDDGVFDTPSQQSSYTGCPQYPQSTCGSNDMFMDFMDYVDDDCMVMFSKGQVARMITVLETFRPGLIQMNGECLSLKENSVEENFFLHPNPIRGIVSVEVSENTASVKQVEIYNSTGKTVFSEKIVFRNKMTFDLSFLPAGIYFFRAGKSSKKIMIL